MQMQVEKQIEVPLSFNIDEVEIQKILDYYNLKKDAKMPCLYVLSKNDDKNNIGGFYVNALNENEMKKLKNKYDTYLSIYNNNEIITNMNNNEIIQLWRAYNIIENNLHIRYIYWKIDNNKVYLVNGDENNSLNNNEFNILKSYFDTKNIKNKKIKSIFKLFNI